MGRYHSPPVAECKAGGDSEMTMTSAVPAQVACGPLRPCAPRAVAGLGVQCGVGGPCSRANWALPACLAGCSHQIRHLVPERVPRRPGWDTRSPRAAGRALPGAPGTSQLQLRAGASFVPRLLPGPLERREERGCLRHGQQRAVPARKMEAVTGSALLARSAVAHGSVLPSLGGSRVCLRSLFVPCP